MIPATSGNFSTSIGSDPEGEAETEGPQSERYLLSSSSSPLGGQGKSGSAMGRQLMRCGAWVGVECPVGHPIPDTFNHFTVLTESGQPCRFPFRYGGRMLHSCSSEGSAYRKW